MKISGLLSLLILLNPSTVLAYDDSTSASLVGQAYCRVLERPVDHSGLFAWGTKLRDNSITAKQLVLNLVMSDEHKDRFYDDDSMGKTIDYLYDHLLDRKPDPKGRRDWVKVLGKEGYEVVVKGLINSEEYNNKWGQHTIPGNGRNQCS